MQLQLGSLITEVQEQDLQGVIYVLKAPEKDVWFIAWTSLTAKSMAGLAALVHACSKYKQLASLLLPLPLPRPLDSMEQADDPV